MQLNFYVMPIDVTKIKPKADREETINNIVDKLFNQNDTLSHTDLSTSQDSIRNEVSKPEISSTGKMLYHSFGQDIIVDVSDRIDPDGYTEVTDSKKQVYLVKANELKPLPDDYFENEQSEQKNDRKPGFWNTYVGDLIERFGASVYQFNGDLYNLADKTDKLLTKIDPVGGVIADMIKKNWEQKHPDKVYKTWLREQADNTYSYADLLRQRSDRYAGKNFTELAKEGDYAGMVGEAFLTASESLAQSIVAMAGGGWGLALTGATAGVQKYDQLDQSPETKDMSEAMKIYNSVATGIFNALFEKLGDAAIGREFKRLVLKHGADEAKSIVRSNLENWLDGMFKKYGVLWMPVSEGLEEVATQISENITDYCTGATDKWDPMEGALENFVYGAAGGAQFSMAGVPFAIRNRIIKSQSRKAFNNAKKNLINTFPNEDTENFVRGLTFMSPAEQEMTLATIARSGAYEQDQINTLIDFTEKANKYKDWNNLKADETDKQAKKELAIQTALHDFDIATSQITNEEGFIQEVVLSGEDNPVYIIKGNVVVTENGTGTLMADVTNSSKELFYKDETGEMQVVSSSRIERIENIVNVLTMRENLEAELREVDNSPEQEIVQDETNLSEHINNGDPIVYRNYNGDEIEGTVIDAYSDAESVFLSDGTVVNKKDIIRTTPLQDQSTLENNLSKGETGISESSVTSEIKNFEIEPGLTASLQEDGTYILDKTFTKSEFDKGKKFIERLNADYNGENIHFELTELPKTNPDNPLEKTKFGILGRIDRLTPSIENTNTDQAEMLTDLKTAKVTDNKITPLTENKETREAINEIISQENVTEENILEIPGKEKLNHEKNTHQPEKTDTESNQPRTHKKVFGANNKLVSREQYDELKKLWKDKTQGQLNVGFDPELLSIGIQMAAFHIEAGARKFSDFAQSMVSDIGDSIKPYLVAIYLGAKHMPGMEIIAKDMDSSEFISIFNVDETRAKQVATEEVKERYSRYQNELKTLYARKEELDKTNDGFVLKKQIADLEQLIQRIEETFGKSLDVPDEKENLKKQIRDKGWDEEHVIIGSPPKIVPERNEKVEKKIFNNSEETSASIRDVIERFPLKTYSTTNNTHERPSVEVAKNIKKDIRKFVKALQRVTGWELNRNAKGKVEYCRVNLPPAGGEATFTIWKSNSNLGIYASIGYKLNEQFNSYIPDKKFTFRVVKKGESSAYEQNLFYTTDASVTKIAEEFEKAIDDYLKKLVNRNNERRDDGIGTLPDSGSENQGIVDARMDARGNISDVQRGHFEGLSGESSKQGNRRERSRNENRKELDRSAGDNERNSSLPNENGAERNARIIEFGADRADRGIFEHALIKNSRNYVILDPINIVPKGEIAKIKANLEAIKLLKKIESEDRIATSEEQKKLSQYSGWGGLSEVLNKDKIHSQNWSEKYGDFHKQLTELFTEDEFLSAINSTINSHYTSGHIVTSLWGLAERLGFKGGKVLEPAAGSGNFLGLMPSHLASKSTISAYELDSITGRILSLLYPDATVKVTGYENSKDRAFDLIITNVPFGKIAPYDASNKDLSKFSLHNYFIAKSIRQLNPGGLGIFITSTSTLDNGASAKFREWVSNEGNADFVGAIRLPNNAFSQNAGTEVTTDIVVFRKRDNNGISPYSQPFRYALPLKETKKQDNTPITIDVNEYFVANPDMMLGEPMLAYQANKGKLYSADDFTLKPKAGENLSQILNEAIQKFATNITDTQAEINRSMELAKESDKEGSLIIRDGEIREVSNGELIVPHWVNEYITNIKGKHVSKRQVAKHYIDVREIINNLVDAEVHGSEDIEELRKHLNEQYDSFVGEYGQFYNNLKLRFLTDNDVDWSSVYALEKIESKYVADGNGKFKRKFFIKKSDIFYKRISFPVTEPNIASSLEDAMRISAAYRGNLNLSYVAKLLGVTEDEAKNKILDKELGFENPATGLVEDKDNYLSGFVRTKLDEAKKAAEIDKRFTANVKALEKVIPNDIPASQIRFRLGTTFIPSEYIEKFIKDKLEISATVRYIPTLNKWIITDINNSHNAKNKTVYGTKRISGLELIYKGLNLSQPIIFDVFKENGKEMRVKNLEETAVAQSKLSDIEDEFIDYISGNEEFINEVARLYNEGYNGYKEKQYTAPSFLHFPGANPDITLREHQRKAIPRILQECTLLAHQVGSGKTYTIITAAMEMRRLKIAKKPLIVVHNQTIEQFISSFKLLYPTAKILSPTKKQTDAKNRIRLFNLISYGDYDAIVVPQSFITMIPDNPERQKAYIKEQISELENLLNNIDPHEEKTLHSQLSSQLKEFHETLNNLNKDSADPKVKTTKTKANQQLGIIKRISRQADRKVDEIRTFEQLGVDALFVDEAHAYKKLGFVTKLANVKGIDKGGSKRAFSMYMKVRYIQEVTGNKNVVFATGTPITNTMAELYTMLRYIAPDIQQKYNIKNFDEFATTFGAIEPSLEFTAAGSFKIVDRFKSYVNLPELLTAFRARTDVVLTEDIKEFKEKNTIPKLKNNSFTQIIIKQSDGLKTIMCALRKQLEDWEKLSGKKKQKLRHIPLVVFNQAKQAAIDLRLLNPDFPDDPGSKTNRVVSEVFRIYESTSSYKGTQLVFCDMYQSSKKEGILNFNLYKDIKRKLIVKGIPENEIAIFTEYSDSQREHLFEQVNSGEKRIMIGGQTMSTGVNVQERLAAEHHVDAPPRPMDFEQRNGRCMRQGNMHAEMGIPIEILTYGVERTLDATAYQRLLIKQNFINQMMKGENLGREIEDLAAEDDASDLNFNQMMATLSGSQYAILHQQRNYELKKLEMAKKNFERRQVELNQQLKDAQYLITYYRNKIEEAEKIQKTVSQFFPDGKINLLKIDDKIYTEKFGEVLEALFQKLRVKSVKDACQHHYKFYLNGHENPIVIRLTSIVSPESIQYSFYITDSADSQISSEIKFGQGFLTSFAKLIGRVKDNLTAIKERQQQNDIKIPILKEEIKKPFDKLEKLENLRMEVEELEDKMQKEVLNETGIDTKAIEEKEAEEINLDETIDENLVEEAEISETLERIIPDAPSTINNNESNNVLALPIIKTKHTKTGADLFVVKLSNRLTRNDFMRLKKSAGKYDGKWSNFTKGFNFNRSEDAEYFREDVNRKTEKGYDVLFREIEPIENEIFYSNAEHAVMSIKQDKATSLQWLSMLKNNGGLKVGEDKWLGLSDWLKSENNKILTKKDILRCISLNKIPLFETELQGLPSKEFWKKSQETPETKYYTFLKTEEANVVAHHHIKDEEDITKLRKSIIDGEVYQDEFKQAISKRIADIEIYNYNDHYILYDPNIDSYILNQNYFDSFEEASNTIAYGLINDARLKHTTKGLNLYKELVLVVPSVQEWNKEDAIHFGDVAGGKAVVWIRFGDTVDKNGKKVLAIDEIQSQRHQNGKTKGYVSDYFNELEQKQEFPFAKKMQNYYLQKVYGIITSTQYDAFINKTKQEIIESGLDIETVNDIYSRYYTGFGKWDYIPDAPFEKNWHEVAFKRMLRYAAENGYDVVTWTKGKQQADRYDLRQKVDIVRWKNKGDIYNLELDKRGVTYFFNNIQKADLDNYLGYELTEEIISSSENFGTIEGNGLKLGGEKVITFYDKTLLDFVRKYVKKWDSQIKDFILPKVEEAGRIMWGVEITPEMRASVLTGQPMFRESENLQKIEKKQIIREIERFKRRLGIDFTLIQNRGELPLEVFKRMKEDSRYPGVFIPSSGKAYIVLDEIASVKDAQRSILHELVGHKGIQGLFGENIGQFSEKVLRSMSKEARINWLKQYNDNRLLAAQEYVASFAEGYTEMTQWNRIKAIIRNFFRRVGIDLKLTDQDLMYLLWKGVWKLQNRSSVLEMANYAKKDYTYFREAETSYDVQLDTATELEIDQIEKVKLHNLITSHSFRFTEAYQDRMLAVKKMQDLIEQKIERKLPDYMNAYLYENTLASKNTYETEYFRNNNLLPLVKAIAALENRRLSRRDIENYVMLKHGLERNEYMKKRKVDKWYIPEMNKIELTRQEDGEAIYLEKMRELDKERKLKLKELENTDFAGISVIADEVPDADIERYIKEIEEHHPDEVNNLWQSINNATNYSLKKWYDSGMIDRDCYCKIKSMYKNYIPLRGWDETVAHDVFEYFTDSGNIFNSPLRSAEGRRSRADDPFAYLINIAESSIIGGNKNLMKLHLLRLAQKYPSDLMSTNKVWYEDSGSVDEQGEPLYEAVFPDYSDDIERYRKNVETFNQRMKVLEAEGKAYSSRSRLNVGLRLINSESEEHIVRVRQNGEEFAILIHGDPRPAQAINGLNDEERTNNRVIKAIRTMNRQMAANFTTRNPAFVVSNLTRDLIFSISTLSVKESSKYRNRFIQNIYAASGAVRRYINGKADYNKPEDILFKEFLENGGETGYTALYNIEKFKKLINREIKNTHRNKILTTGIKIVDFFEAGNRWAEDLSRFSTYMTSRQMGRTVLKSVSDAKEVTVNFNRKGSGAYGAHIFRSLYLFFNAAVQSLANVTGMAIKYPGRTARLVATYAAMGVIVPTLLMALGGDDALKEYLNLPDYVRKNNLCIYLGKKHGFVTIPLPIELRALFGWGDSAFRYMTGDASGETACGEVIMGMLDLLPLNPVGGDTPFIPDAMKPVAQSYFYNRDFTGRPIAKVNEYNKYLPEYQRAYRGTGGFFVKSSEVLNNLTGGDYATRGGLDRVGNVLSELLNTEVNVTNPAALEHLFEAYLGGTFTTINQAMKTLYDTGEWAVTGTNTIEARQIPILNRFYNTGSIYSSQAKINEKYFDALDELKETESRLRRYKEGMMSGKIDIDKALDSYNQLIKEGKIERAEIIKYYSNEIRKIDEKILSAVLSESEIDEIKEEQFLLKEQMIEELRIIQ